MTETTETVPEQAPKDTEESVKECERCGSTTFWRSVHGVVICGDCHPPASPRLVAEWLGESDD